MANMVGLMINRPTYNMLETPVIIGVYKKRKKKNRNHRQFCNTCIIGLLHMLSSWLIYHIVLIKSFKSFFMHDSVVHSKLRFKAILGEFSPEVHSSNQWFKLRGIPSFHLSSFCVFLTQSNRKAGMGPKHLSILPKACIR